MRGHDRSQQYGEPSAAVKRLLDWLSARLDYGWGSGAAHRHGAARLDWGSARIGLRHRLLHALCAAVSIIATLLMPDHTNKDISEERA